MNEVKEVNNFKLEIIKKEAAYTALQSNYDTLAASFDQVTQKVASIEINVKNAEEVNKAKELTIQYQRQG